MSISLDGFVAGPSQSRENPLGVGGMQLHGWHLGEVADEADLIAQRWLLRSRGAYVMGRNMFGPIRGPWDEDWRGWWGDEPPYHAPVFVLTHHAHDPIEMQGGTTFHFVTGGFEAAFEQAIGGCRRPRCRRRGRRLDCASGARGRGRGRADARHRPGASRGGRAVVRRDRRAPVDASGDPALTARDACAISRGALRPLTRWSRG